MVTLRSESARDALEQTDSSSSKAATGDSDSPMHDSRSSSPAKRRADEMDDYNPADAHDTMDVDPSTSPDAQPKSNSIKDSIEHRDGESGPPSRATASHQASTAAGLDHTSTDEPGNASIPSLEDQVQLVVQETLRELREEGFPGYVVSRKWLGRVISRTKFDEEMGPFDKTCREGEIGPVDNSDILLDGMFHSLITPRSSP
jgi:ubiquitin carboxyl-terminal hydrolase 4/11/15